MDELENKNFENEFLNILEEPESTLVFGEGEKGSDDCTSDGGCKAQCKTDACTTDCTSDTPVCGTDGCTPAKGDSKSGDDPGMIYYYWATGRWLKYGYYISGSPYTLNQAGGFFTSDSVSAANTTNTSILNAIKNNTLGLNNMYISNQYYGNFSTTGTSTSIIGTTGSTPAIIGYIKMKLSAITHTTSSTVSIPIYARSYSANNNTFTSYYNTSKTGSPGGTTQIRLQEKTFTIYTKYGGTPVQGSEFTIANLHENFPQYSAGNSQSITKHVLRSGTEGFICLCTSSMTATTITGTVKRKGFNGYQSQSFTATANTITNITLATPQNSDKETIVFGKIKSINPSLLTDAQYYNLNYTHKVGTLYSTLTGEVPTAQHTGVVLTFDKVYQLHPGYRYYVNDPVIGKGELEIYTATQRTLTTTAQGFGSIQIYGNHVTTLVIPTCSGSSQLGATVATVEILGSVTIGGTTYTKVVHSFTVLQNMSTTEEANFGVATITEDLTVLANNLHTISLSARVTTSAASSKVLLVGGTYSYTRGDGISPEQPPVE